MMYRIEWISKYTNYRGHGSWFKPGNKKMLEDSIEFMNKEYRGQFDHWLVGDSSVSAPCGKASHEKAKGSS